MKIELDKIEQTAKAATSGPWRVFQLTSFNALRVEASERFSICEMTEFDHRPDERRQDAEHIATCSPDVVLAMVARIRELEYRAQYLEPVYLAAKALHQSTNKLDGPVERIGGGKSLTGQLVEALDTSYGKL